MERTIRSVLEQKGVDLEYIVVDAGSTDGSRDIIRRHRAGISKIIFEPDSGPANGLNKGFAEATGDVLGYLNADDLLLPGSLREAMDLLEASGADVIYGDGYFIDSGGRCTGRCLSTPFDARQLLRGGMVAMQQSTFSGPASFAVPVDSAEANHTCWDGELFLHFATRGLRIVHAERYWSAFRRHKDGISGSGRLEKQYRRDLERIYASRMKSLEWRLTLAKWESRIRNPRRSLRLAIDGLVGPPDLVV